ncbi:MAG TPA: hypothetical protein VJR23_16205 [Candidatus Acidoferrales bacterium]|nr:hypothetical protein [Candidatus Acidoferrales bacterium]
MNYFVPPNSLVLYSDLSPDKCIDRIINSTDAEEISVFSFSGFSGSKPFLGVVDGHRIRIRRRIYSRNVSILFTGQIEEQRGGSRIAGAFDLGIMTKIILPFLLVGAAFIVIPAVYHTMAENFGTRITVLASCAYLLLALLMPRILRAMGLGQQRDITDFLVETLEASEDLSAFRSGHES